MIATPALLGDLQFSFSDRLASKWNGGPEMATYKVMVGYELGTQKSIIEHSIEATDVRITAEWLVFATRETGLGEVVKAAFPREHVISVVPSA
jgi:hypothetical protein